MNLSFFSALSGSLSSSPAPTPREASIFTDPFNSIAGVNSYFNGESVNETNAPTLKPPVAMASRPNRIGED